jgi:hypothetical protein
MNYSLASARANRPFSELTRIKIPMPQNSERQKLIKLERELNKGLSQVHKISHQIDLSAASNIISGGPDASA